MLKYDNSRWFYALALLVFAGLVAWMFYEMVTEAPGASITFAKYIFSRIPQ